MDELREPNDNQISRILRDAVAECFAAGRRNASTPTTALFSPEAFFFSSEARELKAAILRAGGKLWKREYVDGNGGNLSVRVGGDYAICTPTLCSKGDLTIEDLSLVDLDDHQICGSRERTSEILLHLEIYKAQPAAQAVIHCHPPYATAYALAGVAPPDNLLPEKEVFVGPVAIVPYETPGTMEFARTVLPYVKSHNTILLGNHGIVCWADTIAHAEWYVEVIENYCKTVVIASGIKMPLPEIPSEKIADLLRRKQRMGLPDPRLDEPEFHAGNGHDPSKLLATISSGMGRVSEVAKVASADGNHSDANSAIKDQGAEDEDEIERLAASFAEQFFSSLNAGRSKARS